MLPNKFDHFSVRSIKPNRRFFELTDSINSRSIACFVRISISVSYGAVSHFLLHSCSTGLARPFSSCRPLQFLPWRRRDSTVMRVLPRGQGVYGGAVVEIHHSTRSRKKENICRVYIDTSSPSVALRSTTVPSSLAQLCALFQL